MRARLVLAAPLLACLAAFEAQAQVTIYRCTDASGRLTLQDSPCPAGQRQQAREMVQPKDAPPKPAAPSPAPPPAPAPQVETRVVYLAPPMPMYECTTHEGKRYSSDNGDGNPRWVPYWTLGYPVTRADRFPANTSLGKVDTVRPPPRDVVWPVATGGGRWIRDDCALLPPAEACARLRGRRDDIRTRFFNAQEKERDALRIEERGINARLDNDCGRH